MLKHMPSNWLQQQTEAIISCKEQPSASLVSSFTKLGDDIVMTDIGKRHYHNFVYIFFISKHQLTHFALYIKIVREF